MAKKLVRTGNSLAIVLDRPLLERAGIDARTPREVSTDGRVIIIAPRPVKGRTAKLRKVVAEAHRQYGEVFRRLADA